MKTRVIRITTTAVASLFLGLLTAAATEPRILSIAPGTSGIAITWTNPVPGHAYTLEHRGSLTFGNWQSVPTRYRWPGVMTRWMWPGSPSGSARFFRVQSEPIRAPERGKILSAPLLPDRL
jgi:hypothetical protein